MFDSERIGGCAPFKNGHSRQPAGKMLARCGEDLSDIHIKPQVGQRPQGGVQVTILAFAGAPRHQRELKIRRRPATGKIECPPYSYHERSFCCVEALCRCCSRYAPDTVVRGSKAAFFSLVFKLPEKLFPERII
jgi:hypothetical protein